MTQLYRGLIPTLVAAVIACNLSVTLAEAADGDATASLNDANRDAGDDALKEITVLGQRTTPEIARAAQMQAPNLINLTTAEEILRLPEATTVEANRRLPAISL